MFRFESKKPSGGKKHYVNNDNLKDYNFSVENRDAPICAEKYVPKQGLNETKFVKGFRKKKLDAINPFEERQRMEEVHERRAEASLKQKQKLYLQKKQSNILLGEDVKPKIRSNVQVAQERKAALDVEGERRMRSSAFKFYTEPIPDDLRMSQEAFNNAHRQQYCHTVGVGNQKKLPSYGVLDNFIGVQQ